MIFYWLLYLLLIIVIGLRIFPFNAHLDNLKYIGMSDLESELLELLLLHLLTE